MTDSVRPTIEDYVAAFCDAQTTGRKTVMDLSKLLAQVVAAQIQALLPKQRVQVTVRGVSVDGKLVPPRNDRDDLPLEKVEYADVELAYDQYYLIGDDRGNSVDSRIEGPVPRSRLRGKVTLVWPSSDRGRLQRIDVR